MTPKLYLLFNAFSIFSHKSHVKPEYVILPLESTVFLVVVKLFPKMIRTFIFGFSIMEAIVDAILII